MAKTKAVTAAALVTVIALPFVCSAPIRADDISPLRLAQFGQPRENKLPPGLQPNVQNNRPTFGQPAQKRKENPGKDRSEEVRRGQKGNEQRQERARNRDADDRGRRQRPDGAGQPPRQRNVRDPKLQDVPFIPSAKRVREAEQQRREAQRAARERAAAERAAQQRQQQERRRNNVERREAQPDRERPPRGFDRDRPRRAQSGVQSGPRSLREVQRQRRRSEDRAGNRTIIEEPGNRVIIQQGNRLVIDRSERERLNRFAPRARTERIRGDRTRTVVDRPGGVQIVSITDRNGRLVRRIRRGPDGRERVLIDNRRRGDRRRGISGRDIAIGAGIGAGVVAGAILLDSLVNVPPPRVTIPRDRYIVDYSDASEDDLYDTFQAPPVGDYRDRYTLDEVRATHHLRQRMRRVDLDAITFDFGSWDVAPSEYDSLERVARAMRRVIRNDPGEVFLVEGHTDAVGARVDNLTLSDRRAEEVLQVLVEEFDVPFENLIAQGYGEDYLKINTQRPERANRRVAIRRITPLLDRSDRVSDVDDDDDEDYDERR